MSTMSEVALVREREITAKLRESYLELAKASAVVVIDLKSKLTNAVEKWGICANELVKAGDKIEELESFIQELQERNQ